MDGDNNHLRNSAPFLSSPLMNMICQHRLSLQRNICRWKGWQFAILGRQISKLQLLAGCVNAQHTMYLDAHCTSCTLSSLWCTYLCSRLMSFFILSVCKDSGCLIKRWWSGLTFILAQLACTWFKHLHRLCTYFAHTSHILCTYFAHTLHTLLALCTYMHNLPSLGSHICTQFVQSQTKHFGEHDSVDGSC